MSFRKYAKHRGCSAMAVSKAVREGRIPVVDGPDGKPMIDPVAADEAWRENTDESKQIGAYTEAAGEEPKLPDDVPRDREGKAVSGRAKREEFQARITELKFREMAGELVNAEEVRQEAFRIARQTREAVLSVPDRVAAQIAAEQNPQAVHEILTTELTKALEAIADGDA